MIDSPNRLPIMAWTFALLTLLAAWGALITHAPWNILLVLLSVLGILTTIASVAMWLSRMKAEAHQDENHERNR